MGGHNKEGRTASVCALSLHASADPGASESNGKQFGYLMGRDTLPLVSVAV